MIKKLGFVKISEHLKEIEKKQHQCNVKLNELRDTISYREREIVELRAKIADLKNKVYIHRENNVKLNDENKYLKSALEKINNPLKDISIVASMELGDE
jgi:chromosome segregation ATPase